MLQLVSFSCLALLYLGIDSPQLKSLHGALFLSNIDYLTQD